MLLNSHKSKTWEVLNSNITFSNSLERLWNSRKNTNSGGYTISHWEWKNQMTVWLSVKKMNIRYWWITYKTDTKISDTFKDR